MVEAGPSRKDLNYVKRFPSEKYTPAYDQATLYTFLDSHFLCHVGFNDPTHSFPVVIPMLFGRLENALYIHGYVSGRLTKALREGVPTCITVTQLDGIVCSLSLFNSSANYKSACVFGHAKLVEDEQEKVEGLKAISQAIFNGRWGDARIPNPTELRSTGLIKVEIDKFSYKQRIGPADDDKADVEDEVLSGQCWAGVIPVKQVYGEPQRADYTPLPEFPPHLAAMVAKPFIGS